MGTNCIIDKGYALQCRGAAGIAKVYISSSTGDTVNTVDASDIITGITGNNTYYEVQIHKEVGSFNAGVSTVNVEGGTVGSESTLEIFIPGYDIERRDFVSLIAKNELDIIVGDNDGKYFLMNRANLVKSDTNFGKLIGDSKGSLMSFNCKQTKDCQEVDAAVIAVLNPTV